jgi:regulator of protease activity HflC (stomatin/prohibitin superfamily)
MEIMIAVLAGAVAYTLASLRILKQYERGVTFLLGKYWGTKGPGLVFIPAGFAHFRRVSLRIVAMDVPPQDVITRDNVSIKVNAVLYMRVKNPEMAIIEIEDYLYATSQLAQTTLRSVLGEAELDELLADREKINGILQQIVEDRTDSWGVEVSAVEVKDVDLPLEMKRAMARQAEAERERRAKVIAAEGEFQAAGKLSDAAGVIARHPEALQLRYLQTLVEIASENNSTTLFPIPIDLLTPFMEAAKKLKAAKADEAVPPAPAGEEGRELPRQTGQPVPDLAREREHA